MQEKKTQKVCHQKVVHSIDPPDTDDDNESDINGEFYTVTDPVNAQTRSNDPACVDLTFNDKTITVKIDTGAQVNILPKAEFDKLYTRQSPKRSKVTLHGYGGRKLSNLGVCELECSHKRAIHNLLFHVDVRAPPLLGFKSCVHMKLVKLILSVDDSGASVDIHRQFNSDDVGLNQLIAEYSDLFDGISAFPAEHSLTLHPAAKPVVIPPRRAPVALSDKV